MAVGTASAEIITPPPHKSAAMFIEAVTAASDQGQRGQMMLQHPRDTIRRRPADIDPASSSDRCDGGCCTDKASAGDEQRSLNPPARERRSSWREGLRLRRSCSVVPESPVP